jgi:hypothetical protein
LFRDTELVLKEQLEMIKRLTEQFNLFVEGEDADEIDLEELRTNLRPAADRKISSWVKLARLKVLSTFGKEGESTFRSGLIQTIRCCHQTVLLVRART